MSVWDPTKPTGNDPKSQGDDQFRALKSHIEDMLEVTDESVLDRTTDSSHPTHHYRGLRGATADRPAAGFFGLFFDTDRNQLQRDNGAAWQDMATLIPLATKAIFFQAAAPVGWAKDTTHHGKAIRVVTDGNGGTAGGTLDPATGFTLAHSHTVNAHTHDMGNHTHTVDPHVHTLDITTTAGLAGNTPTATPVHVSAAGAIMNATTWGGGGTHTLNQTLSTTSTGEGGSTTSVPSVNQTSNASDSDTSGALADVTLAYVNAIICSKS